jgi:hypothetical protein
VLLLLILPAGCGQSDRKEEGSWRGEIARLDGRTTVSNLGGRVWEGPTRLDEFLVIGRDEGDEAELFTEVRGIAAIGEQVYVADLQVPMVRIFDLDGSPRGAFGPAGDGPGELRRPSGLAADAGEGRIFIRDSAGARINVYDLEGRTLETRRTPWARAFLSPLVVFRGLPWTEAVLNPGVPSSQWRTGMVACAPDGSPADTLAIPQLPFQPLELIMRTTMSSTGVLIPYSPERIWAMTPEGGLLAGTSDRYRFELRRADGSELAVEKYWEPRVPVLPEEAAWYRGKMTATMLREDPDWTWNGPEVPDHKPAFEYLFADPAGRIWVVRSGPGRKLEGGVQEPQDWRDYFLKPAWEDTWLLDVFGPDGRFLGPVEVPEGMQFQPRPCVQGDCLFALFTDPDGSPLVKGYRLLIPDSARPVR